MGLSRAVGAIAACAALLAACSDPTPVGTAEPTVTMTSPRQDDVARVNERIREARAALGEPMVALAEALLAAAARLDRIRHQVPRGTELKQAAAEFDAEDIDDAANALTSAADGLDTTVPAVAEAAELATTLAADARAAADAAVQEAAVLAAIGDVDERLEDAVAAWEEPGSQSEVRQRLEVTATQLETIAAEAAQVPVLPEECPEMVQQRVAWAELLLERTQTLAEQATSAGGTTYGELRAEFLADPFGVDRVAADAATRDCWRQHSPLPRAAERARQAVEQLEALLS